MYAIGLARVVAFSNRLSHKAEAHLDNGIGADEQAAPRCDGGVALRQQDGNPGQCEAQEIGAAVTQEDFASRPIHQEKSRDSTRNDETGEGQWNIAHLAGDEAEGGEHDDGGTGSQTVEAVNDIDGVGNAADGKGGEDDGNECEAQQPVDAPDIHMGQRSACNTPAQHAGCHGGQQSHLHGYPFGDVLQQAKNKGRDACQQNGAENSALFGSRYSMAGCCIAHEYSNSNGDASNAGCGIGMEFLQAVCGVH